jgi:hypothetical protein
MSVALVVWPLPGGGVYVPPSEVVEPAAEPTEFADALHDPAGASLGALQSVSPDTGRLEPAVGQLRYDAAGKQAMRGFTARVRQRWGLAYDPGTLQPIVPVPFGSFKQETVAYLRRLFRHAQQERLVQTIAISPRNVVLIRQLRALQFGPDGKVRKADDDAPDALIAGVAPIARAHRPPS